MYIKQPDGFVTKGQEHLVCKLKQSIYSLKQSPPCWNSALDSQLKKMGFMQTTSDPCLYIAAEGEMFIIAVYVMIWCWLEKVTKGLQRLRKPSPSGLR